MHEYISREAVMQMFADHVRRSNNSDFAPTPTWSQAVQIVEDFPAADVVEVVRCRDCEFTYEWRGRLYCKRVRDRWNHVNDRMVEDTDFCAWAKRKDGGQDSV